MKIRNTLLVWLVTLLALFLFKTEIEASYFFAIDESKDANPENIIFGYPDSFSYHSFRLSLVILTTITLWLLVKRHRLGWLIGSGLSIFGLILSVFIGTRFFSNLASILSFSHLLRVCYFALALWVLLRKDFKSECNIKKSYWIEIGLFVVSFFGLMVFCK
jgi:hypothetical protein